MSQRKAEVVALFSALHGVWPLLAIELKKRRDQHIQSLVSANDEQIRGRIKELDELLYLPNALEQEIRLTEDALPEEGASE